MAISPERVLLHESETVRGPGLCSGEFSLKLPEVLQQKHPNLGEEIVQRVAEQINSGKTSESEILQVKGLSLRAASGDFKVSNELLERLRRAAQVWDVSLKMRPITSHRPLVGPIIVAVKKMLYPIVALFVEESLKQQRDFNAAVLRCLVELAKESKSGGSENSRQSS